jgi:hypothetical protein
MTGTSTEGLGLGGTLRLTWVTDHLAHVQDDDAGVGSGTRTGLSCPVPTTGCRSAATSTTRHCCA